MLKVTLFANMRIMERDTLAESPNSIPCFVPPHLDLSRWRPSDKDAPNSEIGVLIREYLEQHPHFRGRPRCSRSKRLAERSSYRDASRHTT